MNKIDEEGFINNLKAARNLPNGLDITLNNAGTLLEAYKTEVATLKEQNALLTVQVPEGWKLVPVEILKNIYMLIDPPPIEVDGKMMVFKNPKAADTLTKISAEVRALLDSTAPAAIPQDARDAARYRYLRNRDIENDFPRDGLFIGCIPDNAVLSMDDADAAIDAALSAQD